MPDTPVTLPAKIELAELTQATLEGSGVFDVLMRANKAHLDDQYQQGRIRGPEYATVYLGSLEAVMRTGLEFLLQRDKNALEAQLLAMQIELAQVEKAKAEAELAILNMGLPKIEAEIAHINAETALTEAKTENAALEGTVLVAQECKLRAEFDFTMKNVEKTTQETALLAQKVVTEKAQTMSVGVDPDSVVGRQKQLYAAQTNGFTRDAEQKVAKLMADTWNVRRTTDEGTSANDVNMLNDAAVGRAIIKLLEGVGA